MFNLNKISKIEGLKNPWKKIMVFSLLVSGALSSFNAAKASTINLQKIESIAKSNLSAYSYLSSSKPVIYASFVGFNSGEEDDEDF